ncbi:MAG: hypothetical protein AAGA70_14520 [Pseudomonadota bacterium]
MSEQAREIYQSWLDLLAQAVWCRDFDRVASHMTYPNTMETVDGSSTIETPDEMLAAVSDFRKFLERVGAQAYLRVCTSAQFVSADTQITGQHTTYILRGGTYLLPPFSNEMTLTRGAQHWLGTYIRADVNNHTCTILSPAQLRRARLEAGKSHLMEETK